MFVVVVSMPGIGGLFCGGGSTVKRSGVLVVVVGIVVVVGVVGIVVVVGTVGTVVVPIFSTGTTTCTALLATAHA
jgi:hypothetical protein